VPEDPEKVIDTLCKRIAELRVRAELTQAAVAERANMRLPNYQRIEHGLQNVKLKTLVRISNAIGVGVAEFFTPLEHPEVQRQPGRPKTRSRTKS
jgi:transcriptional regulator with XRE-family HTH domain